MFKALHRFVSTLLSTEVGLDILCPHLWPVPDYRKNAVSLIFAPYLINIRNLPYDSASLIIGDWLKCSELRPLDPDFDYKVKYSLKTSIRKLQLPIKFSTLMEKNKELYKQLSQKMQGITT